MEVGSCDGNVIHCPNLLYFPPMDHLSERLRSNPLGKGLGGVLFENLVTLLKETDRIREVRDSGSAAGLGLGLYYFPHHYGSCLLQASYICYHCGSAGLLESKLPRMPVDRSHRPFGNKRSLAFRLGLL